jgi:hypothetical protein
LAEWISDADSCIKEWENFIVESIPAISPASEGYKKNLKRIWLSKTQNEPMHVDSASQLEKGTKQVEPVTGMNWFLMKCKEYLYYILAILLVILIVLAIILLV